MMYRDTKQALDIRVRLLRIFRRLARSLAYVVAFVLPMLVAAGAGLYGSLQISRSQPPAAARASVVPQPAPPYDPRKPTVAVVLGDVSDANDVLAPYALFAQSGVYNVYTVAPTRELRSLTDGLDIVPQASFAELAARLGHSPDIVVVPAMPTVLEPQNQPVLAWLRQQAQQPTLLFSWCEGAEALAAIGVLDGQTATTHWGAIDRFEPSYPAVRWQRGVRYVDHGRILTAAGLTSGVDATLHLLARLQGRAVAERLARDIQYPSLQFVDDPRMQQYRPEPADVLAMLDGAFTWPKPRAGVWLYNGVGELDLAAILEAYGATWTYRIDTLADAPSITSRHGLQLIPRWRAPNLPSLDRVLVPGGPDAARVATTLAGMQPRIGAPIAVLDDPTGRRMPYAVALEDLARQRNLVVARYATRRLEYRADDLALSGNGWPLRVVLVPLLLGVAGALGAGRLLRRKRAVPRATMQHA